MGTTVRTFITAIHRAADSVTTCVRRATPAASVTARTGIHTKQAVIARSPIDSIARITGKGRRTIGFGAFIPGRRAITVIGAGTFGAVMLTTIGAFIAAIGRTKDSVIAGIACPPAAGTVRTCARIHAE